MTRTPHASRHILALIIAILFAGSLRASEAPVTVSDSWIRATPPGASNGAGFLTLHNHGNTATRLTGISCTATVAARCEIHEHLQLDGRMRMQQVTSIDIPPQGSFRFAPGGHHVMLLDLARPLTPGDSVELVLTFADQSTYRTVVPVKPLTGE